MDKLLLLSEDWCWSVGTSRITGVAEFECRIFPKNQKFRKPVIICIGQSIEEACQLALSSLGSQDPQE